MINNLVICGIVRNVGKVFENNLNSVIGGCKEFNIESIYVVESDSSDNTLTVLNRCKKKFKYFDFTSCGVLREKYALRLERICYCRNLYLDFVKKYYNKSDYFLLIVDFDNVSHEFSLDNITSDIIKYKAKESFCFTANQSHYYYDLWALRHEILMPHDCWKLFRQMKSLGFSESFSLRFSVLSKHFNLCSKRKIIVPVDCAFGGAAIYTLPLPLESKYVGIDEDKNEVIDHYSFVRTLRDNSFNIYIHSQFISNKGVTLFHLICKYIKSFFR